jgi:hypothetical protein
MSQLQNPSRCKTLDGRATNRTDTPPRAKLKRGTFLTELELARLLTVSKATIRAWRRRGETPAPATDPEALAFAESKRKRGSPPVVFRCAAIAGWLFGKGDNGRPPELPASAFDPANDQTMQLRRAGQAAKNAGAPTEKPIRRQITTRARFVARLGFDSPTAYEAWVARGSPEDEMPCTIRLSQCTSFPATHWYLRMGKMIKTRSITRRITRSLFFS